MNYLPKKVGEPWPCVIALLLVCMVVCPADALEVNVVVDQETYFVGEPIRWSFTATNDSDEDLELRFPTTGQFSFSVDRVPDRKCGGGDAITYLNFAPRESITWTGTDFLSDVGSHTFNGRICWHDFVAEPVTFDIIEPPPTTEDVVIDFETFPDGSPTRWPTSEHDDSYLGDAFAQWGVRFPYGRIARKDSTYGTVASRNDEDIFRAELGMPVYGVTAEVSSAEGTKVMMAGYDINGQLLASSVSSPIDRHRSFQSLSLSAEKPIASIVWNPTNGNASIAVDNVALTVDTVLPLPDAPIGFDVNIDGVLDVLDLDLISAELLRSTARVEFDFDENGVVNGSDHTAWLERLGSLRAGDVNLDGRFSSTDLVEVFVSNEYQDQLLRNSTWSTGDWSGDLEFTSRDLVVAFQDGGYENAANMVIPEPTGLPELLAALIGIAIVLDNIRKAD